MPAPAPSIRAARSRRRPGRVVLAGTLLLCAGLAARAADYAAERREMIAEIERTVDLTRAQTGKERLAGPVMAAMARVPRHEFVPADARSRAYANRPLPIGHGQTISQPYIVALMTDLLEVGAGDRVLEVGTGSGYQAAVLAELVDGVYTMEIIEPLAESARARLARLGYDDVEVRFADGYHGWPEHAPYDGIVVTAAATHIPPPLVRQLAPGARMVIPVGERFTVQHLLVVHKREDGRIETRQVLPVRFVPLTGGHE